jgi:hypothetical protein
MLMDWIMNQFYSYLYFFIFLIAVFVLIYIICYGKRSRKKFKWTWDDIYESFSTFHKRKAIPKKHESRCRFIFESLFKAPFTSVRPDFLKYKTGKNLELDGYNSNLKLAFEYQGVQHRKYTPMFHKTYRDFKKQQERDEFKKQKCIEHGIRLIEIPDTVLFDDLESYIREQVKGIH